MLSCPHRLSLPKLSANTQRLIVLPLFVRNGGVVTDRRLHCRRKVKTGRLVTLRNRQLARCLTLCRGRESPREYLCGCALSDVPTARRKQAVTTRFYSACSSKIFSRFSTIFTGQVLWSSPKLCVHRCARTCLCVLSLCSVVSASSLGACAGQRCGCRHVPIRDQAAWSDSRSVRTLGFL